MQPPTGSDPIARARLRNERVIARLALATAAVGIVVILWRIATVEARAGGWILAFAVVAAGAFVHALRDDRPLDGAKTWFRSTLEVSCASVVMLLDTSVGPSFLVTSSTPHIYVLAVAMSCLRLRPTLCLYVSGMAIAQQTAIYIYALRRVEGLAIAGSDVETERFYQELLFRDSILLLVGVLGFMLARTLAREIAAAAHEERVRATFGSYVDARVVKRVLAGDLKLAPERRTVTVLFVDIRGFTKFSETREPEEVFAMLTEALDAFATVVQSQGGIVNKFLGDGLMALFGAPEEQADQARRAVRAGLLLLDEARIRSEGRFPGLRIGIGIHTGEVVVGDLGSARREYTAIGDVVNVASRVEAANKELGTSLLITDDVRAVLGSGASLKAMPPLPLRGRTGTIPLFEVVEMEGTAEAAAVRVPAA